MKVLVPLDGSVLAESMLQPALRLADGGELFLVRVLPSDPGGAEPERAERDLAERYLEAQRQRLSDAGVDVRWDLEGGDPVERILVVARERAPDCLALATHGLAKHLSAETESVAERVVRRSRIPVLLVNPRAVRKAREAVFKRLLVPLDDSRVADAILPHVERIALTFDSTVTLLRALPGRPPGQAAGEGAGCLEARRAWLAGVGVRVEVRTVQGDPAEEILDAAAEFDVVCMATHGRVGLGRWWFGSVAEEVLRRCGCPVLVIRP